MKREVYTCCLCEKHIDDGDEIYVRMDPERTKCNLQTWTHQVCSKCYYDVFRPELKGKEE